jgi:hypothetical protein
VKVVEIRRRRPEDGSIERLARVYVARPGEGAQLEVLISDFREGLEQLMAEGATDNRGELVRMEDGERFVDALPSKYRSSRFWAEEVDEEPRG